MTGILDYLMDTEVQRNLGLGTLSQPKSTIQAPTPEELQQYMAQQPMVGQPYKEPLSPTVNPGTIAINDVPITPQEQAIPQAAGQAGLNALNAQQQLNQSLAPPSDINELRRQAEQYLNLGVNALATPGTQNGLTKQAYEHLAAFTGNPAAGDRVFNSSPDMVQKGLLDEAKAAETANEYQKQRATALLANGVPEAANLMKQNIADYANPLNIQTVPTPQAATALPLARARQEEMAQDILRKNAITQQELGYQPRTSAVDVGGARGAFVGNPNAGLPKPIINPISEQPEDTSSYVQQGQIDPDTAKTNAIGNQNILRQQVEYTTGVQAPAKVEKQVNATLGALDSVNKDPSFQNGVFRANPKIKFDANTVFTPSSISQLSDKAGFSSSGRQAVSALLTLAQQNPQFRDLAQETARQYTSGNSINVEQIKEKINNQYSAYQNDVALTDEAANRIKSHIDQGTPLTAINPDQLKVQLQQNKYVALTPEMQPLNGTLKQYGIPAAKSQVDLMRKLELAAKKRDPKLSAEEAKVQARQVFEHFQGQQ